MRAFSFSIFGAIALMLAAGCGARTPGSQAIPLAGLSAQSRPDAQYPPPNGSYSYHEAVTTQFDFVGQSPDPSQTSSFDWVDTVTSGQTFDGKSNLVKIASNDVEPAGTTGTSAEFLQTVQEENAQGVELIGEQSSFTSPTLARHGTTTYSVPYLEVEVPFQSGRTWNATSAGEDNQSTTKETINGDPASGTYRYVFAADGSYSEVQVDKTRNGKYTEYNDYSENISGLGAIYFQIYYPKLSYLKETIEPPVLQGSTYVIPVAYSYGKDVKKAMIPDWYPGGGKLPSTLATDSSQDMGSAAIPASCHVPATIAKQAEKIVETYTSIDVTSGTSAGSTNYYYAQDVGLVCFTSHDVSKSYNTLPAGGGLPAGLLDTYTIDEVAALTADKIAGMRDNYRSTRAAIRAATQSIAAAAAALPEERRRLLHEYARQRLERQADRL